MENIKLGQKRVQRNFNPSATCNSISDPLLSTSTTTFINQGGEATLVETNVLEDSIEMIYEETSNIISSVYPSLTPEKIHFKIVFSCVNGKWNKSERIYAKKIEGFSYFESEQKDKCPSNKSPIARINDTNIMNIKISILNKFNTELSVYSTDLDSYELNKKHNISIERSIDQMIHKIHFEQNLNEKNTEISNKSDSKKSEIEIKIGEYCECKSVCNEYENKTCKGVEKRKTNKTKKMKNYKVEIFDENTFKSKGIVDTKIPEILVKTIQESLNNLNENLVRTPLVLNEEELTPSFGIMVKDKKGLHHLKYRVNISLFNKPKKIKK